MHFIVPITWNIRQLLHKYIEYINLKCNHHMTLTVPLHLVQTNTFLFRGHWYLLMVHLFIKSQNTKWTIGYVGLHFPKRLNIVPMIQVAFSKPTRYSLCSCTLLNEAKSTKRFAPQLGSKQALIYALDVTMTTTPSRQLRADIHPTGESQWENE